MDTDIPHPQFTGVQESVELTCYSTGHHMPSDPLLVSRGKSTGWLAMSPGTFPWMTKPLGGR
jgi:hypothetical protein